jgi:hypothetical protein
MMSHEAANAVRQEVSCLYFIFIGNHITYLVNRIATLSESALFHIIHLIEVFRILFCDQVNLKGKPSAWFLKEPQIAALLV